MQSRHKETVDNLDMKTIFGRFNFAAIVQALVLICMLIIGWVDSTDIVIIYALETVLIGIFHVFKMLIISFYGTHKNSKRESGIALTLFFIVHYGFFVFIQTTFFFTFLSMNDKRIKNDIGFDNFYTVMQFKGVQAAALVIVVSLLIKLFRNFLAQEKYINVSIQTFMFVPYLRIILQQFVAILPGFFIIFFDGGFITAIILIILRTGFDLLLNRLKTSKSFMDRASEFLAQPKKGEAPKTTPEEVRTFLNLVVDE